MARKIDDEDIISPLLITDAARSVVFRKQMHDMRKITIRPAAGSSPSSVNTLFPSPQQNAGVQSTLYQAIFPVEPQVRSFPAPSQQVFLAPQLSQSLQPVPHAHNTFILIIDDSPTVCKIVETCLHREGFKTRSFENGIEAMRWLTEHPSSVPDLIILDVGLPKMDGYEVARHLKAKPQFANSVIVMLTQRSGVIDRLKGRLAGAKTYMIKPFKTEEILSVVKSHLDIPLSSGQEMLTSPSAARA